MRTAEGGTIKSVLMPNTHCRRRRDETVESRRVGGVYWALRTDVVVLIHLPAVTDTYKDGRKKQTRPGHLPT